MFITEKTYYFILHILSIIIFFMMIFTPTSPLVTHAQFPSLLDIIRKWDKKGRDLLFYDNMRCRFVIFHY